MLIVSKFCPNPNCFALFVVNKYIHTTAINNGASKVMKKVLGLNSKNANKRRRYVDDAVPMSPNEFSRGSFETKKSTNSRRSAVLNKLFMKNITDLMANGESAGEFVGHGIEINRVKVTPDFKSVLVYWIAKGNKHDEEIDAILERNSYSLRHELSQLRVMGEVPTIKFVKDKHYAILVELDARLSVADYGEDHVPIDPAVKLKTQLELHAPLSKSVQEKIHKLEEENHSEQLEESLPEMPQNVLGLDHARILNSVKSSLKKSETLRRLKEINFNSEQPEESSIVRDENVFRGLSVKNEREAFKEFLHKRQLLRSKLRKVDKNYSVDLEYLKQELEEQSKNYFNNMDVYDFNDDDYYYSDQDCDDVITR